MPWWWQANGHCTLASCTTLDGPLPGAGQQQTALLRYCSAHKPLMSRERRNDNSADPSSRVEFASFCRPYPVIHLQFAVRAPSTLLCPPSFLAAGVSPICERGRRANDQLQTSSPKQASPGLLPTKQTQHPRKPLQSGLLEQQTRWTCDRRRQATIPVLKCTHSYRQLST